MSLPCRRKERKKKERETNTTTASHVGLMEDCRAYTSTHGERERKKNKADRERQRSLEEVLRRNPRQGEFEELRMPKELNESRPGREQDEEGREREREFACPEGQRQVFGRSASQSPHVRTTPSITTSESANEKEPRDFLTRQIDVYTCMHVDSHGDAVRACAGAL